MFVDARTIPHGSVIEADVCIVGAGAAGITLAREFRAKPLRVALVESGWFTRDDATQALYAGEVREIPYFPLDECRTRHFGGTTNVWTGECRPLDALDFDRRDWIPESGWPFGIDQLLPSYERGQALCELGRFAYTAEDWHEDGVRPIGFQSERVCSKAFQYSPPTRFGEVFRDELKQATNVIAYLGANVIDLETPAPPTRVSQVSIACLSGNAFRVKASIFILAAGGIENARLLLMANKVQPAGLGNTYDRVGRYFMEHLYVDRAATILARDGIIGEFYTSGHWSAGRRVRGILGLSADVQRQERLTNCCAVLEDDPARSLVAFVRFLMRTLDWRQASGGVPAYLRNAIRDIRATAAAHLKKSGNGAFTRFYLVKNVMEQAPNPESRVVLSRERDALGCPRVALCWRTSPIDKRTAHRAHEIFGEELWRAGAGRLQSSLSGETKPLQARLRGARHHMGTTRMHPDPRRGVVDADCRVHGIANLYVAGSSVFPTSGAANPTLTIVALALRLAGHVNHGFR
ncbi:MAG: GMC oxidoreductase [Candidatus Binatia bacterium]